MTTHEAASGQRADLLTTKEVAALIAEQTGRPFAAATWTSYQARAKRDPSISHPVPAPVERRDNKPFYSRQDVLEWLENRPGQGRAPRPSRRKVKPATGQ